MTQGQNHQFGVNRQTFCRFSRYLNQSRFQFWQTGCDRLNIPASKEFAMKKFGSVSICVDGCLWPRPWFTPTRLRRRTKKYQGGT